nr:unnamed protein product [Digitaria exilis]
MGPMAASAVSAGSCLPIRHLHDRIRTPPSECSRRHCAWSAGGGTFSVLGTWFLPGGAPPPRLIDFGACCLLRL